MEVLEDFNTWYKDFINKNQGFEVDKDWFNRVQKSHKKIRSILGDVNRICTYNIQEGQKPASQSRCAHNINGLLRLIPKLNEHLNDDLSPLLLPTIQIGKRTMTTSKALTYWFDEAHKRDHPNDIWTHKYEFSSHLSALGQHWNKAKTDNITLTVEMTTKAQSFALLGHYGPDEDSCFHQEGGNDDNKYVLGQTKDTFVLLVSQDGQVITRCWGFKVPNKNIYTICNFYYEDYVQEGNIQEAFKLFFANLLKTPYEKLQLAYNMVDVDDGIYYNRESLSFADVSTTIEAHVLAPNIKLISHPIYCDNCDNRYPNNEAFDYIDGALFCPDCVSEAHYCEYSKQYTWSEVIPVKTRTGTTKKINEDLRYHVFDECDECHEDFTLAALKTTDVKHGDSFYNSCDYIRYCCKCYKTKQKDKVAA